jgi:hypothetical protein
MPLAHVAHCEFDPVLHVSGVTQPKMSVQGTQADAPPMFVR